MKSIWFDTFDMLVAGISHCWANRYLHLQVSVLECQIIATGKG